MIKRKLLLILSLSFILTACGETESIPSKNSYDPVDIYVSQDVDILGNKINGNEVIEIGSKEPSISEEPVSKTDTEETPEKITEEISDGTGLEVYFIDVGQADSILIRIDNKDDILIDGGNNADGDDMVDYLKYLGVDRLSAVIATHPHEDHIGATDVVISEIPTDMIYMPYVNEKDIPTTKTYKDLLLAIEDNDVVAVEAKNGMKIYDTDKCKIEIISPDEVPTGNLNDYSIVAKLTYGDVSFLFTGDAEEYVNEYIMSSYQKSYLDVDVIKAGHHGSRTSNSEEWVDILNPEYAVIMCGEGNSYGHPHKEVLKAYEGVETYRTDLDGTIKMTTDGKTISIETKLTGEIPLGDKGFDISNID